MLPKRIGEFTTVSTSNFYFYPPSGSGYTSTPQGYLLAAGSNGFLSPQNPSTLISTIVAYGYLASSISTVLSSTTTALSNLSTFVSTNAALQAQQISTQTLTVSSLLYVNSNVGIGCNAPIYDLDVAGSTHTYKLNVDYANVFQSTPSQIFGSDVSYIFSTISADGSLVPSTVILTKPTDVFSDYNQVIVTYGINAKSTGGVGANKYGLFQLSTNSYLHSNQYVVGPFDTTETRRLDVTTVLRRGYDFSSNDNQVELILVNSANASYFLGYFSIVGLY